jgi:chemotaxis protein methyltransferase CheR
MLRVEREMISEAIPDESTSEALVSTPRSEAPLTIWNLKPQLELPPHLETTELRSVSRRLSPPARPPAELEIEHIELKLLLEGLYQRYGHDFREYSLPSVKRRVMLFMKHKDIPTISHLQDKLLRDRALWQRFLPAITVNVTSMFRDPEFYRAFREHVVPILRDLPFIRIWHAGCATGEEVYSMTILFIEEGLYQKSRVYATDMNEGVLRKARAGIYPLQVMEHQEASYRAAGGVDELRKYYSAKHGTAMFPAALRQNTIFSPHNLATDGPFNEFNVICCRNVAIYFSKPLQDRVQRLFYRSLAPHGVLGLGQRESIKFTPHQNEYRTLSDAEHLYQRID